MSSYLQQPITFTSTTTTKVLRRSPRLKNKQSFNNYQQYKSKNDDDDEIIILPNAIKSVPNNYQLISKINIDKDSVKSTTSPFEQLTLNINTNNNKNNINNNNNNNSFTSSNRIINTTTEYKYIGKKRKLTLIIRKTKKRKLNNNEPYEVKNNSQYKEPLFNLIPDKKYKLSDFEILSNKELYRGTLRRKGKNNLSCKYLFGNNWILEMDRPLGRIDTELKPIIDLLSKDLRKLRIKLVLQTQNKIYIIWIRNNQNKIVSAAIIIIDDPCKRVNIEMLATDKKYRGKGLAEIIVRLIQYKMYQLPHDYLLFVTAAKDAIPFWSKEKFQFREPELCYQRNLKSFELVEERKGHVKRLMWYGNTIYNFVEHQLFQLFKNFNGQTKSIIPQPQYKKKVKKKKR